MALVVLSGLAHVGLGIAAITGAERLEANVFEIESNPNFGQLYLSLAAWGAIAAALGLGELAAASAMWRRSQNARLLCLVAAYAGLGGAFFSLAIFRWASLATIVLLLIAIFVLSYRSSEA